ncbi:MAG: carboxypeptidase regulatory-like domain-containing protein [Actinobacteria bacterium]|nr:carboxypeptidase regulatory-like domain-containing protein [Actinomycetota bacterium]
MAAVAGITIAVAGCGGSGGNATARYTQVQAVFVKYQCAACHPVVNPSLDLRPGHEYASLVGVRAVEDPRLVRVIAGDPERSFLYQKIAGDPQLHNIPAIGARMPQGAPRMAQADIDLINAWIKQGAQNAQGKTAGPAVPTPGVAVASPVGSEPPGPTGTSTIKGVVEDERHRPLPGAIVTLLLRGQDQPDGEEHYRAAATDARGRYELRQAPVGQYLLKAYASKRIYVSRIVALADRQTATVDFGLPPALIRNPVIAAPHVRRAGAGTTLSMTVTGNALDPNYTLAVNPGAGLVFELHRPDGGPGLWTRTIPRTLSGRWIFLAVDHQCDISEFLTVSR